MDQYSFSASSSSILNRYAEFLEEPDIGTTGINRTFEELITERGDLNIHFSNENKSVVDYTLLFEKIKEKLFIIDNKKDIKITECDDIKKFRQEIFALKNGICDKYIKLSTIESELNQAKEKYSSFCDSVKNLIHFVYKSETMEEENDEKIKEILENKIETYYKKLNITELLDQYETAIVDYEKTKLKISMISGTFLQPTICQICLERQVEFFIDPCGHTICKHCKPMCETIADCHYCRTKKKGYKRLFL